MSELAAWQEALGAVAPGTAHVVERTASTQELAAELNAGPGDVVATLHQDAGRGRMGRSWEDPMGEGIAVTVVLDHRLAVAPLGINLAVALAEALDAWVNTGICWPNDLLLGDRKLAGVLIERRGDACLVGIGVNVLQTTWGPSLAGLATSLAAEGKTVTRWEVAAAVAAAALDAPGRDVDTAAAAWRRRDVLIGTHRTFEVGGREVSGDVVDIDPNDGLIVQAAHGRVLLPAHTTTMVRR